MPSVFILVTPTHLGLCLESQGSSLPPHLSSMTSLRVAAASSSGATLSPPGTQQVLKYLPAEQKFPLLGNPGCIWLREKMGWEIWSQDQRRGPEGQLGHSTTTPPDCPCWAATETDLCVHSPMRSRRSMATVSKARRIMGYSSSTSLKLSTLSE